MIRKNIVFIIFLIAFTFSKNSIAEVFPGSCIQWFYINEGVITSATIATGRVSDLNFSTANSTLPVTVAATTSSYSWTKVRVFGAWWDKDLGRWHIGQIYGLFTLTDMSVLSRVGAVAVPSYSQTTIDAAVSGCPVPTCSLKKDQVNYDLKQYDDPNSPPVAGNVCYEDCQQSAEILWNDCLAGSCVASIKYTATGESCGVETSVENLQPDPPDKCTDEINEKIQQCGGTLKILSYDFETCTGECTPDACGDQWKELVDRCGGIMAVSTWDAETCSGSCVNDPLPDPSQPDSEAVPGDINTEVKTNPDGSKVVEQTKTYYIDNTTYTETTTTTYDSSGNKTGESTSTTQGPTVPGGAGGSPPSSWYTKTCDLTQGFESCVNYQQVRDATAAFNDTFIVQFPNLILDCLGYVEGDGCVYPPVLSIDFHNAFTSDDIIIDLTPFESVAYVMKFFFSLLCLLLTGKAVMYLYQ